MVLKLYITSHIRQRCFRTIKNYMVLKHNYHLNALDDLARAKYLMGQHERLEIIKKERKEHQIEKELKWNKYKQKIRCCSSSVDKYFECEND